MKPVHILLIEDNPADAELARDALEQSRAQLKIDSVNDGELALDFLLRRNTHTTAPEPDLVFLDLNLPKIKGCEVLKVIRGNAALRHIPVVVLSSSNSSSEVRRLYDLGANCYLTKPLDHKSFTSMMRDVVEYWMATATLPRLTGLEQ